MQVSTIEMLVPGFGILRVQASLFVNNNGVQQAQVTVQNLNVLTCVFDKGPDGMSVTQESVQEQVAKLAELAEQTTEKPPVADTKHTVRYKKRKR